MQTSSFRCATAFGQVRCSVRISSRRDRWSITRRVTPEEAADAGIRSIEHLANYQLFDSCVQGDTYTYEGCAKFIDKLAATGVWQTPTMAFFETLPDVFEGAPLAHS